MEYHKAYKYQYGIFHDVAARIDVLCLAENCIQCERHASCSSLMCFASSVKKKKKERKHSSTVFFVAFAIFVSYFFMFCLAESVFIYSYV